MLQLLDTVIDLLAVTGVKNLLQGSPNRFTDFLRRKMDITVPEFSHSLIMLRISRNIKMQALSW